MSGSNFNLTTQQAASSDPTIIPIYSKAQLELTTDVFGESSFEPLIGHEYIIHGEIELPLLFLPESVDPTDNEIITFTAANQANRLLFNGSDTPHIRGRNAVPLLLRADFIKDTSNSGAGNGTILFDYVGASTNIGGVISENTVFQNFKSLGNVVNARTRFTGSTSFNNAAGLTVRSDGGFGMSFVGYNIQNLSAVTTTAPGVCLIGDFGLAAINTGVIRLAASDSAFCIDSAATGSFGLNINEYNGIGDFFTAPISETIVGFSNVDIVIDSFRASTFPGNSGTHTEAVFATATDLVVGQTMLIADEAAYDGLRSITGVTSDQLGVEFEVVFSTSGAGTLKRTQVNAVAHGMVRDQTNTIAGAPNHNGTTQILKLVDSDNIIIPVAFVAATGGGTVSAVSKDHTSIGVISALNGEAPNSRIIGLGRTVENATVTTIAAVDTYQAINVSGMVVSASDQRLTLTNATNGVYRYDGAKPTTVQVTMIPTAFKAGSTEVYRTTFSLNGAVPVFGSTTDYAKFEIKTTLDSGVYITEVDMVNGDTIQPMSAGVGTSDNLTFEDFQFDLVGD